MVCDVTCDVLSSQNLFMRNDHSRFIVCCSLYRQVKHFVHIEPGSGGRVDTTSRAVNGRNKAMDCVKNIMARMCCVQREVEMVGFNLKAVDFEEWTSSEEEGGEGAGEGVGEGGAKGNNTGCA